MGSKLMIKISILFFALMLVVVGMNLFSSKDFKHSLENILGKSPQAYSWCPENSVDFAWLDSNLSDKWKTAAWPAIQKRFCHLTLEPIQNVDLATVEFVPLLKVQSAEAKSAQLEWNAGLNVFRVNGLPFYSPSLVREILDR